VHTESDRDADLGFKTRTPPDLRSARRRRDWTGTNEAAETQSRNVARDTRLLIWDLQMLTCFGAGAMRIGVGAA